MTMCATLLICRNYLINIYLGFFSHEFQTYSSITTWAETRSFKMGRIFTNKWV